MRVTHILKDGTVLDSIVGRIVKMEDAKNVYALIDSINSKRKES